MFRRKTATVRPIEMACITSFTLFMSLITSVKLKQRIKVATILESGLLIDLCTGFVILVRYEHVLLYYRLARKS